MAVKFQFMCTLSQKIMGLIYGMFKEFKEVINILFVNADNLRILRVLAQRFFASFLLEVSFLYKES